MALSLTQQFAEHFKIPPLTYPLWTESGPVNFGIVTKVQAQDIKVAGIYGILRLNPGSAIEAPSFSLLYVGKAHDSFADRLSNHENRPSFESHGWTHVALHPCSDELQRQLIESELQSYHRPPINERTESPLLRRLNILFDK